MARKTKAPKTTKTNAKTPRKQKASGKKAQQHGGDGRPLPRNDNGTPEFRDQQANFLAHARSWDEWKAKLKVVEEIETEVKAALKNDGWTVKQFQIRDALLAGPKQEQRVRGEIEDRVKVARMIGHKLGDIQLDLFAAKGKGETPPSQSPEERGRLDCMESKTANPPYPPDSEDAQKYMTAYHDETERRMAKGLRKDEPKQDEAKPAESPGDPEGDKPAAGWGAPKLPASATADSEM